MNARSLWLAAVSMLLLGACGSQQAGYQITDRNHSLSVTRDQQYPGSDWINHLVVSRFPECQRRYKLKESPDASFKMDVYRVEPGVFILNHGKRWYIAETGACRWQQYENPPPEPGELIGSFENKGDTLAWVPDPKQVAAEAAKQAKPAKAAP